MTWLGRFVPFLALLAATAGCGLLDRGSPQSQFGDEADWRTQALAIEGIVDYTETAPELLDPEHRYGPIAYPVLPPPGGPHHPVWQNCQGDVYDAEVPNEHAVHSLEHGAIWITYHPSLPSDQVAALAGRVRGNDKMLMSPYPSLDAPISLQAWGYQLKLDWADDPRVDEFIRLLRINAAPEPHASCSGGVSITGTTPMEP
ncbi:MAG TPA: DUF3105 domain-containing protein [Natronosporangium sp.]|nr:DUF3105 domain-containing protein [Natronosporangium sp.]